MTTLLALTLLVTVLLAATASAYPVRAKPAGYVDAHLHLFRLHTNAVRAAKCLPRIRIGLAAGELPRVGSAYRRVIRIAWKGHHWRGMAAASNCLLARAWAWYYRADTQCVVNHEGGWSSVNPAGPYYGRFQMDATFQRSHGPSFYERYGPGIWPREAQLLTAFDGYSERGWAPWPTYARYCT